MEKMTLAEISAAVGSTTTLVGEVISICTDTRSIVPGCLFVALSGDNFDGHNFVKSAIEQGAIAAVTEQQIGVCACIVVSSTRKALLDIAKTYRKKFSPILVGITGSVGKTTTKEMVALVLSARYKTLKNEGNMNNEIGVPLTLFGLGGDTEAAVIEMGMSHFGEIHRLSRTAKPTLSLITNVGFSHIENLGSQEGILKAKLEILDGMEVDAPLIINADDRLLSQVCLDREIITYGIENTDADVLAKEVVLGESTTFDILYGGRKYAARLSCGGRHNVLNALAAFTIGIETGVPPANIIEQLDKYRPLGLRQNIVFRGKQRIIIDCYNASPTSMEAALELLAQTEPERNGRHVAVLGDMLELGEHTIPLHEMVGEMAVAAGIDKLICYGDGAKYIAKRADELGLHAGCTQDRGMLLEYLKATLLPDDVVLFKASRGVRLEEIIEEFYKDEG